MITAGRRLSLRRLNTALDREVQRLHARYQLSLDEFRGAFISDEQVDALLAGLGERQLRKGRLPKRQPHTAIDAIVERFRLNETATDVLTLALAPDVNPAYAQIYAYLNDDVRKRWPTFDLAQRLFGKAADGALVADGPLRHPALLLLQAAEETRTPLPLVEFAANPVLAGWVLGGAPAFDRQGLVLERSSADGDPGPLAGLAAVIASDAPPLVAMIGAHSTDREDAVRALAGRLKRAVVRLTVKGEADVRTLVRDGILAARLEGALLLIEFDSAAAPAIASLLRDARVPVFLFAPADESWRPHLAGLLMIEIGFKVPDSLARRALWTSALSGAGILADADSVSHAAERFRLSGRQIAAAAASLRLGLSLQPDERATATADSLLASARRQTEINLGGLAQRLPLRHGWKDLVLPPGSLNQLRRLGAAIRHRERVFSEWGFGGGPGVTALFSGGPGTGKSMSAGVLAREAGLDLWRIDLSAIVSKYIGETEKHLDRVFALAVDGNAILFFDEADALFGKRSEVKDAHDRYANIEAAFLLQRLESFDGVVVLASNLARNVDPAFSRRMHFVIDFPLPDVALRERLWWASLPERAPVADDVDVGFLARQFMLAGGDIRVAALDAAFAAADEGVAIDMARLCQAVARQLLKQGKIPAASDFQHYRALLIEGGTVASSRTAAE